MVYTPARRHASADMERKWRAFAQRSLDTIQRLKDVLPDPAQTLKWTSLDRPGLRFERYAYSDPDIVMELPNASFTVVLSDTPTVSLRREGNNNIYSAQNISSRLTDSYASQTPGVMEHLRSTPMRLEAILNALVNNAPLDPTQSWEDTLTRSIAIAKKSDVARLRQWINIWGSPAQKTGVALADNFVDDAADAEGWLKMLKQTFTMEHPGHEVVLPEMELQ